MNKHVCSSVFFVAIFVFVFMIVDHARARRAIPDDNLAYPVLITLKTSSGIISRGSGFYLNTDNATYLVTAKHVLNPGLLPDPATQKVPDAELELLSYSKDLPDQQRIVFAVNLSSLRASGDVKPHPTQDVVVVKVGIAASPAIPGQQRPLTFLSGVTVKEYAQSGVLAVAMEGVRTFDQVLVGNDAILYGYPVSLGIRETPQFDSFRPLLRKALVAGQDPQKRSIILDGPVYRGNSGGPVFQIELDGPTIRYNLIGVVIEFIPLVERADDFTFVLNSGYSVVKPMDFVLELVK